MSEGMDSGLLVGEKAQFKKKSMENNVEKKERNKNLIYFIQHLVSRKYHFISASSIYYNFPLKTGVLIKKRIIKESFRKTIKPSPQGVQLIIRIVKRIHLFESWQEDISGLSKTETFDNPHNNRFILKRFILTVTIL
jgi:hypothetical protein